MDNSCEVCHEFYYYQESKEWFIRVDYTVVAVKYCFECGSKLGEE